jgi:hypothetical protein
MKRKIFRDIYCLLCTFNSIKIKKHDREQGSLAVKNDTTNFPMFNR